MAPYFPNVQSLQKFINFINSYFLEKYIYVSYSQGVKVCYKKKKPILIKAGFAKTQLQQHPTGFPRPTLVFIVCDVMSNVFQTDIIAYKNEKIKHWIKNLTF